jgi:hypothetical protein
MYNGKKVQIGLEAAVKMLPTPSATEYGSNQGGSAGRVGPVRESLATMARRDNWPTPQSYSHSPGVSVPGLTPLDIAVRPEDERAENILRGQLNPTWVCWLMDWPISWTSLEPMSIEAFDEWKRKTIAGEWFDAEPDGVPRVATGVKDRVARLKAIGNGQVPACAALAWQILSKTED